jgi:hypothetical protein
MKRYSSTGSWPLWFRAKEISSRCCFSAAGRNAQAQQVGAIGLAVGGLLPGQFSNLGLGQFWEHGAPKTLPVVVWSRSTLNFVRHNVN